MHWHFYWWTELFYHSAAAPNGSGGVTPPTQQRALQGARQISGGIWLVDSCAPLKAVCLECFRLSPWMLRGAYTLTPRQRLDIVNYPRNNGRFHETPTAATHSADTGPNAQNNAGEVGPFDRGPTEVHGFHSAKMGVIGKVISHLRGMWCCFFGNTRSCVKYTV